MCFAAAGVFAAEEKSPNLRVGILSDVHVNGERPAKNLERALRYFDSRKVDAVLIAGDLVCNGRLREFKLMAETWFKVFPDDRRSDGVKIERLFVTGNHDVDGFAYGNAYRSLAEAKADGFFFNREKFWHELFHEDYKSVSVKTVKGYTFVLRNWLSVLDSSKLRPPLAKEVGCKPEANPTEEFLVSLDLPNDRPFFYVQHEMPNDTVNAPWLVKGERWGTGHDDGTSTKFLSKYPNVITFSGHSHNSLTDEMSIWQGAFTAVNCSCNCGFVFTAPGRENGWCCDDFHRDPPMEMPPIDIFKVNQGLVMEVYDDAVVLERHEFRYGHRLGSDWVIPTGPNAPRPYTVAKRLKTAKNPAFPVGAEVKVWQGEGFGRDATGTKRAKEKHTQMFVSFPAVRTKDGSPVRAWDYAVRAELVVGDVLKTLCERSVFSEGAFYAEEDETNPVVCAFNRKDLPMKVSSRQKVRFVVMPRSCWGVEGKPIASPWIAIDKIARENGGQRKVESMATGKVLNGKPYAGNPHVRFDEGEAALAATPRRGSLRCKILTVLLAMACASVAHSADKIAGLREKTGVNVQSGTVTETDNVILSGDGEFYKTGAGTYVLPGAKLNQQRPVNLVVTDGTLKLKAGEDATVDATTPPTVMQDASFWVDAGRNVVTEVSDGATRVTRWCDARETNTATPTMGYGVPAWRAQDEGFVTLLNVKPAYVTKDGVQSVYFGGDKSGQYMNFVTAAGADRTLSRVKHAFVVHGVYDCLGAVIGGRSKGHGIWLRWKESSGLITQSVLRNLHSHIENYRCDIAAQMFPARWYLDGRQVDISRTMPELGKFQLLAADFPTSEMPVSCFYNQMGMCYNDGTSTTRGGDYLAEAVFFERQLSEAERLAVESYLMKKWNLGADKLAKGQVPVDPAKLGGDTFLTNGVWTARLSGNVAIASGATLEVEAAAGTKSPIVSLTGEGEVVKTGEGSFQIGAQKGGAFTGDIDLRAGTIDVRGGAYPVLKAVAGKTVTGEATGNLSLYSNPTNQYESSARYSVQDGAAGVFTKNGKEPLAVSKVDADVTKLSVAQGQLQLVGPRAVKLVDDSKALSADDLHIGIVDPGFEYMTVTNRGNYEHSADASEICGWTRTADNGVNYLLSKSDGVPLPDVDETKWSTYIARKPVEGDDCIKLDTRYAAPTLKQSLDFKNDGRYMLSFYTISMINSGWNYTQQPLLVKLDGKVVGYAFGGLYGWWRCYIDLGEVTAGPHELEFSYNPKHCWSLICIDDVRIDFTGAKRRAVADFAIPYGDFEEWEPAAGCTSPTNYPNVGDYNHAKGWTLTSTDETLQEDKFPVFVATDAARLAKRSAYSTKLLSVRSKEKTGCSYLGFISNKGRAATEFTAPQGVWFLKAKIAHARGDYGSTTYGSAFSLQATLTRADSSTVDLGTVTAAGVTFDEVVWPKGLVFAEPENVTLTLTPVNASIGVIDDLRLGFADVNLVANGGFENGTTGWLTLVDKSVYSNASAGVRDVTSESQWHGREYGYCVYEGMKYLLVMNMATAYQDIDFPEPGYYRLSFAVRSRVPVDGFGRNLLTFWQGGDDMGAITTNKIVQLHPNTMNFVEHSYLFYVPKKGVRRIGISGEGNPDQPVTSGNQCTSVVDAFSIVRALDVDADAVPSAPSKMRVSVAAGATLNLDFPGTLACGPVTLGGTTVYGLVNAQTYPQYITGVGSLQATNPGVVIILR